MKNIKGFIKSGEVAEVLWTGYKSGQNVVLYGPGGYGKSMMAEAFLRQIGARKEQTTVKSLSVGTTLDDLLGGINLKILRDTGELIYNVEKSIFSTPYLILEEAFDAPTRVLEGLKDILTSGQIRNGRQVYKVRTKFIIVATNRSKEELVSDESSKALMERFPLSLRVEWKTHEINDYKELIHTVFNTAMPEPIEAILKYVLNSIKEDESKRPPSPRTVVRMVKIFNAVGIGGLKFMDGIPNISRAIEYMNTELEKLRKLRNMKKELEKLEALDLNQYKFYEGLEIMQKIEALRDDIKELENE